MSLARNLTLPTVGLAVSCRTSYPPSGGSSVHVYQLWHRLQRMGYEVHTCGKHALQGAHEHPWTKEGLAEMIRNVDLLYVRFPFGSDFSLGNVARLLLRRGLPVVCEFNAPHYQLTREYPPWTLWTSRTWLKFHALHQLLLRFRVDHAICTCDELAGYVRSQFGMREVTVLPDAGDPDLFRPELREDGRAAMGVAEDDFVVFWCGGTEYWWQGLGQIFEAAQRFTEDGVRFVIAGKPEHLPKPLPGNVTCVGQMSYFDIPKYIAGSDVCLCIYENPDWCPIGFWGSPMKLFDYMACGRATIASSLGQIRQVIRDGENGLLTEGAPDDIAAKIALLRRDPDLRAAMGRAARETVVRRYNWEGVAAQTDAILQRLLRERGRGRRSPEEGE